MLVDFIQNESGQGTVEYVLIMMLVTIVAVIGVRVVGEMVNERYYKNIQNAVVDM